MQKSTSRYREYADGKNHYLWKTIVTHKIKHILHYSEFSTYVTGLDKRLYKVSKFQILFESDIFDKENHSVSLSCALLFHDETKQLSTLKFKTFLKLNKK